jgi:hypothetical protein
VAGGLQRLGHPAAGIRLSNSPYPPERCRVGTDLDAAKPGTEKMQQEKERNWRRGQHVRLLFRLSSKLRLDSA